jgi:DNA repair exonuclease SbcCD nuclease subunit
MKATIGVISDIHVSPPGTPPDAWHNPYPLERARAMLAAAVERVIAVDVDAVVLLGDLAHLGDPASLSAVLRETASLACPVHILPGNHDLIHTDDALSTVMERHGGQRAILAPTAVALAGDLYLVTVALAPRDAQGAFHAHDLPAAPPTAPLMIFTHFPLLETRERLLAQDLKHAGDLHNRPDLKHSLVTRTAPTIVVHGHLHVRDAHATGPVLQLACAALIEPPHEVTVLEIEREATGEVVVTRHAEPVAPPAPGVSRIPVLAPADQTWRFADDRWTERT